MNMINLHPVPWEPGTLWERFAPTKDLLPILRHELIFLLPVKRPAQALRVGPVSVAGPDLDVAEVGAQADLSARREEYLQQWGVSKKFCLRSGRQTSYERPWSRLNNLIPSGRSFSAMTSPSALTAQTWR